MRQFRSIRFVLATLVVVAVALGAVPATPSMAVVAADQPRTASSAGTTVSGVVSTPSGAAGSAHVFLRTLDHKPVQNTSGATIEGVATSATTGAFSFLSVPDGSFLVTASPASTSAYGASLDTPVTVAGGTTSPASVAVTLTTAQYAGAVRAPSGAALTAPASLKIVAADGSVTRYVGTAMDGSFKVGGLPMAPGSYTITAFPPRNAGTTAASSAPQTVALGGSGALSLTLTLGAPSITGTVVDANGTPVRGAGVRATGADGTTAATSTRDDGTFALGGLAAQAYTVRVRPPYGVAAGAVSQTATVANGAPAALGTVALPAWKKTVQATVRTADGTPVTDARVTADARDSSGHAETTQNTAGVYALTVGPGAWVVRPVPASGGSWVYGREPLLVTFGSDPTTTESQAATLTVAAATGTVTGTVTKADGTFFAPSQLWVRVQDVTGFGNGAHPDAQGRFTLPVPAGTYRVSVSSTDPTWLPPATLAGTPVTVGTGNDAVAFGTIAMTQATSTLAGKVVDGTGAAAAGVPVHAWRKDGSESVRAVTDAGGNYALPVVAGSWYLQPAPPPGNGVVYLRAPQLLDVGATGTTTAADLTLTATDATISGSVVDSTTAQVVTTLRGTVVARGRAGTPGYAQAPVVDGRFTLALPHGQYTLTSWFAPGSGYTQDRDVDADATTAGAAVTTTLPATATTATVAGAFLASGTPVVGQPGAVFAAGSDSRREWTRLDPTSGSYSLNVAPGDWIVRGFMDPDATGYTVLNDMVVVHATSGQTTTKNMTAVQANATLTGTVTDPTGAALGGVRVWAEDAVAAGRTGHGTVGSTTTDKSGAFTLRVPAGTYTVRTAGRRDKGLAPAPSTATVTAGATTTVTIAYLRAAATITGTVSVGGSSSARAFVRAYPADGGSGASTTASAAGVYSLTVAGGRTWVVQAVTETNDAAGVHVFRSAATRVVVPVSGQVTLNLALLAAETPPAAAVFTFDVTLPQAFTLANGTTVVVPAGAAGTSGTATLRATPKSKIEASLTHRPLNFAYELAMFDATGRPVTRFNSPVSVVIPYDPATLPSGTTATNLVPSYWDPVSNSYKQAENTVVDVSRHTVTLNVFHFTDFAVLADQATQGAPRQFLLNVFNDGAY